MLLYSIDCSCYVNDIAEIEGKSQTLDPHLDSVRLRRKNDIQSNLVK